MTWTAIGTLSDTTTVLVECDCATLIREGNQAVHACSMRCVSETTIAEYGTFRCTYPNNHGGEHYAKSFSDAGELSWS